MRYQLSIHVGKNDIFSVQAYFSQVVLDTSIFRYFSLSPSCFLFSLLCYIWLGFSVLINRTFTLI